MPTAQPWWVASIAGVELRRNASTEARDLWHATKSLGIAENLRPKGIFDSIRSTVWRVSQELNISLAVIPVQFRLSLPVCSISNISSTLCDVPIYSRDHLKI